MAKQNGGFDDEQGFFESLAKYRDKVPMPDSMSRLFKIIVSGAVLLVVGLVTWAVWPGDDKVPEDALPVVRYADSEYKVAPDEPGGMPIPNKDSTVFESMDAASAPPAGKTENLLEDEEQPMKKDEAFNAPSAAPVATEVKEEIKEAVKDEVKSEPVKDEVKEVAKEEVKEEAKEVVAPSVAPAVAKKENVIETLKKEAGTADKPKAKAVTTAAAPKAATKGSAYIQLAAVKSEAEAKTKWSKLQTSYASLKSLSLRVQKADLGDKGVFYRVQAGPLSADAAMTTCGKIKAAGGACIIAK